MTSAPTEEEEDGRVEGEETRRAHAHALRLSGNDLFQRKSYVAAIEHYTRALGHVACDEEEDMVKILNNRSAAYAKLGDWEKSLLDAERALGVDASSVRSYYRGGVALLELGHLSRSLCTFELGLSIDPQNKQLGKMVEDLQGKVRDVFQRSRTEEVKLSREKYESTIEERLIAECLSGELERREREMRRECREKRKAKVEEQQRALFDSVRRSASRSRPGLPGDKDEEKNYYEILGVSEDCLASGVRKQYLKLIARCHPDKPEGSRERFEAIKEAYDVLSNKASRADYDAALSTGKRTKVLYDE